MSLGKLTVGRRGGGTRHINPRDIFSALTLRGTVQNLWAPQSEALDGWFAHRTASDTIVEMATGGGKTLVGLLAAQSTTNETRGHVLYLCANKQLVDQTVEKASELGLPVAAYHSQKWFNRDAYVQCAAPCITTYAAAFTARSVFKSDDVAGLVLDDAHVAVAALRSQFTLKIPQAHEAFGPVLDQLRPYFVKTGRGMSLDATIGGDHQQVLFVPGFVFGVRAAVIANLLRKSQVEEDSEMKWPWHWLSEKLDRCFALVGPNGIEIAPAIPPIHAVGPYRNAARRILLTATLPSSLELARVFGLNSTTTTTVRPTGKLGTAQRQILFVSGADSVEHRRQADALIKPRKACVVVGSYKAANAWVGAEVFQKHDDHQKIKDFAADIGARKMVLVARFDGVDLPGAACRVLVLDGLPRGAALLERFLLESVRVAELRASTTAVKIVQALGRIFRSNTDHGVVILCGTDLHDWLKDPTFRSFLPPLLQQQVVLGLELAAEIDAGNTSFTELMAGILDADPNWDSVYTRAIDAMERIAPPRVGMDVQSAFISEHQAHKRFWEGDYAGAAQYFTEGLQLAEKADDGLAAWMAHLAGVALQKAGDPDGATRNYLKAAGLNSEFGRPEVGVRGEGLAPPDRVTPSSQANSISIQLMQPSRYGTALSSVRDGLDPSTKANVNEEHLKQLGLLLGLRASRPDAEQGTGPDVLWETEDGLSLAALEAKTEKKQTSKYNKKDEIGQMHDHAEWLKTARPRAKEAFLHIVGPIVGVSDESNPPHGLLITPIESFQDLIQRLRLATDAASSNPGGATPEVVERSLRAHGLTWPKCVTNLNSRLAVDLRGDVSDGD